MSKTILVCGGAGYVGSMTCKILKNNDYIPIVVDDLRGGHKHSIKFGPFEVADIGNIDSLNKIIQKYKPIAVMHFAGVPSVPEANSNVWECYNNNISKTNNLLKAMLDNNLKNIIFSSTAAIFGEPETGIINENSPMKPISSYGKSKAIMESILDEYDLSYQLKSACLRYFNVSGCDPDLEVGECHNNETHIIPVMLDKAAKKQEFVIFGNDYDTKDGTCVRDYIHVEDIAIAHLFALEKLLNDKKSFKVNLGNGRGFSVKEIVDIGKEVTGVNFPIKIGKRREGDPAIIVTDNLLAKKLLSWKPKYENPVDHIKHAWAWYKKINNI